MLVYQRVTHGKLWSHFIFPGEIPRCSGWKSLQTSVDSSFFLVNHHFLVLKPPFFYGFLWISIREITMNLVHLPSPHRLQSEVWLFAVALPLTWHSAQSSDGQLLGGAKDSEGLKMGFAVDKSKAIINHPPDSY